jgi:phosphate starvation-inducible PhoH-like protein
VSEEYNQENKGDFLNDKRGPKKNAQKPQLISVKPRTINQNKIFEAFDDDKHIFIHGTAGTGKSFIAVYLGLDAVINEAEHDELIIIRSAVASRRQGFLPGNEEEKNGIFELPYDGIVTDLYGGVAMYRNLKNDKKIRFMSTSYLRGITLKNAVILIEEVQNFNWMEINTVMTRISENCKIIINGDTKQNDLIDTNEESCIKGLPYFISKMPSFVSIEMGVEDIQRNDIVREWIIATNKV